LKVLLIGWDAADWKIINPLMDSGKMPALERLVNNGVIANLSTLDPPISPMLWTSIATGKTADKHGILGFVEPDTKTGGLRPVNVTSRKVKAIWNILHNQGKKCNVVGWWPSHPAEPINGVMVSNFFHKGTLTQKAEEHTPNNTPLTPLKRGISQEGNNLEKHSPDNTPLTPLKRGISEEGNKKEEDASGSYMEGMIYPPEFIKEVFDLRVHPSEITQAHILPFVPDAAKIDQSKDPHIFTIAKIIAEAASTQAITTYLLENTEWDFTAVYFDSIDHFCHAFMKYYPPKMEGIPDRLYELYKNVVSSAYIFHDMMLERLIELAGKDTTIMLVSDHGFRIDRLRPRILPDFSAAPIFEHSPFGIFCASGENIKKDERIYGATLLDIVPTLLTIFGLPAGRDMDGKVLTSIFEEVHSPQSTVHRNGTPAYIDSWENKEGNFGTHPSHLQENAFESAEALRQLVELGYIEEPAKDKKKAVEHVMNESRYNLSRVFLSNRKYQQAAEVLEELNNKDTNDIRYNLDLATCYLNLNNYEKAGEIINNLRTIQKSPQSTVHSQNFTAETLRHKESQKSKKHTPNNTPLTPLKRGISQEGNKQTTDNEERITIKNLRFLPNIDLLEGMLLIKQNNLKKGLQLLKAAEKSNPRLPNIHLEIGKVYLQLDRYAEAGKTFTKAINIDDSQAGAYHGLAVSMLRQKRYEEAVEYALTAIGMMYHSPGAHYHLGEALYRLGKYDDAEKAFEVCLKISPDFNKAHLWIHKIRSQRSEVGSQKLTKGTKETNIKTQDDKMFHAKNTKLKSQRTQIQNTPILNSEKQTTNNEKLLKYMKGEIIIVSGLPRSGTSLMMNMLQEGGIELLSDNTRKADNNNPYGYFEHIAVKNLQKDNSFLIDAKGKAVKVVSHLLYYLPDYYFYKIIYMKRNLTEVLRSQQVLMDKDPNIYSTSLANSYQKEFEKVDVWANKEPNVDIMYVNYADMISDTKEQALHIKDFLHKNLDISNMIKCVNPELYRNKL
jgi:predicted AlkP superfamily phosphohydrolase/phosphomutase/tetratricopeptide (TPR) repeat protein